MQQQHISEPNALVKIALRKFTWKPPVGNTTTVGLRNGEYVSGFESLTDGEIQAVNGWIEANRIGAKMSLHTLGAVGYLTSDNIEFVPEPTDSTMKSCMIKMSDDLFDALSKRKLIGAAAKYEGKQ